MSASRTAILPAGSESHENIYLHDMDYSNSASISSVSYSASSHASPAEKSKNANFEDIAYHEFD